MGKFVKSQVQSDFPDPSAPTQAPTPAPAPAPALPPQTAPTGDLGMLGLTGGGDMGFPSMPQTAPMASPASGDRQEIIGPIESPTQIFYDMDISNFVENNLHMGVDELTSLIWKEYGGSDDGKKDNSKLGKRTGDSKDLNPDDAKKERDITEDSKWERLPKGKSIADIISYSDLGKIVSGLMYGITTKIVTQSATPAAGTAMASSDKIRIILANNLDDEYLYKQSDTIINQLIKKIKLS